MQMLSCLFIIALSVVYLAHAAPQDHYSSRYEQIDHEKILSNKRILINYVNCVVDKGPCTREASDIKKILPEILSTACAKCSPGLKNNVRKSIIIMRQKYPDLWKLVVDKFDPKGEHGAELDEFIKGSN